MHCTMSVLPPKVTFSWTMRFGRRSFTYFSTMIYVEAELDPESCGVAVAVIHRYTVLMHVSRERSRA